MSVRGVSRLSRRAARGTFLRIEPVLRRAAGPVGRGVVRLLARFPGRGHPPVRDADGRVKVSILLMHAYGMGGTIRTTLNVAAHLAQRHDVEIVSVLRRRTRPFFPFPPGVQVTQLDDLEHGRAALWRAGRRLLVGHPSVLTHEQDYAYAASSLWTDLLLLLRLRRARGIVIATRPSLNLIVARHAPSRVVTIGQEHMHFHSHRDRLAEAIRRDYPRLDVLTVLSRADLEDYRTRLGPHGPRVVRIPNAVEPSPDGRSERTAPLVVAAGRLTRQKGFDLLIRAFEKVAAERPSWRLRIYGDGRKRQDLQDQIEAAGLLGVVELAGSTDQLGAELSKGTIFVLSSRFEGFGMVLIEAMSKGLAVVSFDCPQGPGEIITDGEDGILVPPGDVDGLAAAIVRLIDDEQQRHRLGTKALSTAAQYDLAVIGRQWDELVGRLIP